MAVVARVSVAMQKQILELHAQGMTSRAIAKALKVGRNTIKRVINNKNIVEPGAVDPAWAKSIDWAKVKLEASRGVQMNILAREHAGDVISYVQFWRHFYKKHPELPQVTMKLTHRPGEKCFFDYSEGLEIIDHETGEVKKTSLMCGVMAMSSMTYGEFTFGEKREQLTRSIENAFRFFGGVTPYVTVDNQKAAVNQAHWYDPDTNPAFIDFANHWGFACVPARPYRPRDKGANESAIGVVQRQFYQEVRERKFYSLAELNGAFRIYLDKLNATIMKDWGISRNERFKGEKNLLRPCPVTNWETAEWRSSKVHADCHVQVQRRFYSVPFAHVGREVRVKLTANLIEAFDQNLNPLCVHARLLGKELYSTDPRHYPEEKLACAQFSVRLATNEAAKIGPETSRLVNELLSGSYPLRYLRRVQGILRLKQSGRVSAEALEHAAKMAITFNKLYFAYVKSTAELFDKTGLRPRVVCGAPNRSLDDMYLHNQPSPKEETNDQ